MLFSKVSLVVATIAALILIFVSSCREKPAAVQTVTDAWEKPRVPDWHKNATIYEVNLRHYTKENTFKSFEAQIPRLKEMGIDILWFMPINPVSVKNRKGELGSPYSIGDYYKTNPDFHRQNN